MGALGAFMRSFIHSFICFFFISSSFTSSFYQLQQYRSVFCSQAAGNTDSDHSFPPSTAIPQFTISPQDQSVLEGHTVDFACAASGYPVPVIAWTRGGSPLPLDRRHAVLSSGTLRITRVAAHDEGEYECQAVSAVGTARVAVQLSIQQRGECARAGVAVLQDWRQVQPSKQTSAA